MAAVTQTIPNFLGGVSNQPDDKKLPGQVRGAINAYPDPTFGLTKRPGFKYLTQLATATTGGTAYDNNDLDNAKWFYISRDTDEKYVGCVLGHATPATAAIHIWNAAEVDGNGDYVKATVAHHGTLYTITGNGGDNGTPATLTNLATTTDGSGSGMTVNLTITELDDGTKVCTSIEPHTEGNTSYKIGDKITISKSLVPGTGSGSKINEDIVCTIRAREVVGSYLNATTRTNYNFLNVRDTSIITNKTTPVKVVKDVKHTDGKVATIKLHMVEYSARYELTITTGGTDYNHYLDTRAGDTPSSDGDTSGHLDAEEILTALKTAIDAGSSGVTATVINNSLEIEDSDPFKIKVRGGKAGASLTVYQNEVDQITDLSSDTKHGRIVKIINTFSVTGVYYTKFKADNEVSGSGLWEECRGPGEDKGLALETMPHQLYNSAKNAFIFSPIDFVDRLVGDSLTNTHPSFVKKDNNQNYIGTIQQAFYNNNRLGFLTGDNVSMSKSGDYFNMYFTSAQTSTANDPIDLSCSSIKDATLHGVIPTAGGLLLFSQNQQFILYAADGNLSPQTALIRGLSNYRMDVNIDPVDVGSNINFVSKTHDTAGYTRVFGMLPQGAGQMPKVIDIGRVVSEYIPATITGLTANSQNSFIAMWGNTDNKIYFYRTYSDGEQDLIQCWFNWECPGNIHHVEVDSDTMYSVVKTGTGNDARYNLVSATMTQTPEETIIVTSTGQQVNPHMDLYAKAVSVSYDSTNDLSKCRLPYSDIATLDPVIIIAGNATTNFSGTTESGFTIEPDRLTDSGVDYFTVPSKDLSGQAANVYVGYKYKYDVTLPKMYFRKDQEGRLTDYTAPLTIARMKFSVGQSSVVGFKLNRKGVQAATQSFTGDGSNKVFSPNFTVKDKADVIVKKNGAKQILTTDYTIADHATNPDQITVTFGTAPAAAVTAANVTTPADSIEIYVDNWYTIQPTQDANYYLGDDVPLDTQSIFTIPIHQRTDNYTLRVYSDSPFPLALTSMAWEGNYSPRYYRRT